MRTFLLALALIVAWLLVAPGMARACDQLQSFGAAPAVQYVQLPSGQIVLMQSQPMFVAQPQAVYGFGAVQARVPRTPLRTFGRAVLTRPATVQGYGPQGVVLRIRR